MIDQTRLKQVLDYLPLAGLFIWNNPTNRRVKKGSQAGTICSDGYVAITIDGQKYMAHRLAYLYMVGSMPEDQIDHIDRDRANNKWQNIRSCSPRENQRNTKVRLNNTSGFSGVTWHKDRNRWRARIHNNEGVEVSLGSFVKKQDAINARLKAEGVFGYIL
jgi:hypothetical protein